MLVVEIEVVPQRGGGGGAESSLSNGKNEEVPHK